MTATERIVLQKRDKHLLRELSLMRVVDREQAKLVAGFGSTTRANLRLLRLTRAKLLRRFFLGTTAGGRRAVYALTEKGAHLVNVPYRGIWRRHDDETLVADFFVQHQLRVNKLYCALKYKPIPIPGVAFRRWISFSQPLAPGIALIPDGYVELTTPTGTVACFLEVDLGTEPLRVWKEKVEHYLQFARRGEHERLFGEKQFRVLVVANSLRRSQSIRQAVAPIIHKIFWFTDFQAIDREGLWGRIWFRPKGDELRSLIEPSNTQP